MALNISAPRKGSSAAIVEARFTEGWTAHPLCERSRRATPTKSTACFSPMRRLLWQQAIGLAGVACGRNTNCGGLSSDGPAIRPTSFETRLLKGSGDGDEMTDQASHIDHAGGHQCGDQHRVHRGLQSSFRYRLKNRQRSMNETQVMSPNVCFFADSYLVYERRRDSRFRHCEEPAGPATSGETRWRPPQDNRVQASLRGAKATKQSSSAHQDWIASLTLAMTRRRVGWAKRSVPTRLNLRKDAWARRVPHLSPPYAC